jgi:phosphohistidine phosphatase
MELILWRHAEAEDAGAGGDAARALTRRGRKQAERMGGWLKARLSKEWIVLSSPAKRAVQTAEGLAMDIEEREALGTSASVASILAEADWPVGRRSVVIVGHQPTLGEVAAKLLGARAGISVRKGAIWWFAAKDGQAVLRCVLDPDLLER